MAWNVYCKFKMFFKAKFQMRNVQAQNDNSMHTITIARSVEEVESMRELLEKMTWHPNAQIDYFLSVVDVRPEISRPHVMLLSRNKIPEMILVGRIEYQYLKFKIGYKVLYGPTIKSLTVVYGGILGNNSYSNSVALIREIINCLVRGEAEVAILTHIKLDSQMYQLATTMPGFLYRDRFIKKTLHWKMSLHSSLDEYRGMLSKKTRAQLRYHSNRLGKKFGEHLTIKCIQNKDEFDRFMRDIEAVAVKTYHRGIGVGFVDNIETRRRFMIALECRWLQAYVLYIQDNPCAFWIGLRYGRTFFTGETGYDPAYSSYSIGIHLLMRIIEELFRDKSVDAVDFGFGDAEYKRTLCNQNWEESSVYIFVPNLRGFMLNVYRRLSNISSLLAELISRRLGIKSKLRKLWRQSFTTKRNGKNRSN